MYLPGPWLKKGENEIIILDITGPEKQIVQGLTQPVLDVLHVPELVKHRKKKQKLDLSNERPLFEIAFKPGKDLQTIHFTKTEARYFCFEVLSSQRNDPFTTIAEIYLLDEKGKKLSREKWKVLFADSEEIEGNDGNATNVFDLQSTTFWHTEWINNTPKHPHYLVIDIGEKQAVSGLEYLPRQDSPNGRVRDFRFYLKKSPFKGI
jgi:beta-galactosidase